MQTCEGECEVTKLCEASSLPPDELERVINEQHASLAAAALQVPAGWKLVPLAPSEDMIIAGMEADVLGLPSVDDDRHVLSIYSAMLGCSPALPSQKEGMTK